MSGSRSGGHPVEAISALADGELEGAERSAVEGHIASCPACRALLDDFVALARALPEATAAELPRGLASRVEARLDTEGARPRRRYALPVAAAATLAAIALLATVQVRRGGLGAPTEAESPPAPATVGAPAPPPPAEAAPLAGFAETEPAEPPKAAARRNAAPRPPSEDRASRDRDEAKPKADAPGPLEEKPPEPAAGIVDAAIPEPREDLGSSPAAAPKQELSKALRATGTAAPAVEDAEFDRLDPGAFACPSPWKASEEAVWSSPPPDNSFEALATTARIEGGDARVGRDDRGPFVTVRVPTRGWTSTISRLRSQGIRVSPDLAGPPISAGCAVIDVRLGETPPR